VDGGGHALRKVRDKVRDTWLQGEGFKVLRFWNTDVLQNIDEVLEAIKRRCPQLPFTPLTGKGWGEDEMEENPYAYIKENKE
jgi:hypothetical protein